MNNLSILNPNQQTMSTREIAKLLGKNHSDIKRSAERLYNSGVLTQPLADTQYINPQNGQTYSEYHLDKRNSIVLAAQNSPEFTAVIVDRWQYLESSRPIELLSYRELEQRISILENSITSNVITPKINDANNFDEIPLQSDSECAYKNHKNHSFAPNVVAARNSYFNGEEPARMGSKSSSGIKGVNSTAGNYWKLVFAPDGWGRGGERIDCGYFDNIGEAVKKLILLEIKHGIRAQ